VITELAWTRWGTGLARPAVSLRWVLVHMIEETAGTPATWTSPGTHRRRRPATTNQRRA